mmetsp:Transcript_10975/g.24170  ORF Transcript_10975/g.24170 Transcript_10975/m.24170 type:complete len:860 (+) Transcript_10975:663-3242(+)
MDTDQDNVAVRLSLDASVVKDVNALLDRGTPLELLISIKPHGLSEGQISELAKAWLTDSRQGSNEHSLDVATCVLNRSRSVLQSKQFLEKMVDDLEQDAPEELKDPLTYMVMTDPVVVSSGLVLDRSTVLDERGKLRMDRCPITREELKSEVYPIMSLKRRLVDFAKTRIANIFKVVNISLAEDCQDREPDYALAQRVVSIGCTFLKEVGAATYANESLELNKLKLKVLELQQELALPIWVGAYQDLIDCSKLISGKPTLVKDSVHEMEGRFLSQASSMFEKMPHDPQTPEQWLQALCGLLQKCSAAPAKRAAPGDSDAVSTDTLLKITDLLLHIAKSCNDSMRLPSARAACYFALKKVKADPARVERFLKEEEVAEAHLTKLFHSDVKQLCKVNRKQDSTSSDDFLHLASCTLPSDQPIQSLVVKCKWQDQGWGNKKGAMRVLLRRPRPASPFDGHWQVQWQSGDTYEAQVHCGIFAVHGVLYNLEIDTDGGVTFKWPDGTVQTLAQRDRGLLTWSTTSSDRSLQSITWTKIDDTRYPPLPMELAQGERGNYYCARRIPYFDGPNRWCTARRRSHCHCDGVCGPGNGCQCAVCYIKTHNLAEDTVLEQDLFGVYGQPERPAGGEAEVERVFDASSNLLSMRQPGDTLQFQFRVGGGGGHSLLIQNFVVSATFVPVDPGPQDNQAYNEVAMPPVWLAPFLFEGQTHQREVTYTDGDGDVISFKLEDGNLVKYVNGTPQVGGNRRTSDGIVTELVCRGTRVNDQHGWGGNVPREVLPQLSALADLAGVEHNLPSCISDVGRRRGQSGGSSSMSDPSDDDGAMRRYIVGSQSDSDLPSQSDSDSSSIVDSLRDLPNRYDYR